MNNIQTIVTYLLSVIVVVFILGALLPLLPAAIASMNLTGATAVFFGAFVVLVPIVIGVYLLMGLFKHLKA